MIFIHFLKEWNLPNLVVTIRDTHQDVGLRGQMGIIAKLGDMTRIYSSSDASGKLYLKRIQTVAESKKQSKIIRYPLVSKFKKVVKILGIVG